MYLSRAVYHERTKHSVTDYHLIQEKIRKDLISAPFIKFNNLLLTFLRWHYAEYDVQSSGKVRHNLMQMPSLRGCVVEYTFVW